MDDVMDMIMHVQEAGSDFEKAVNEVLNGFDSSSSLIYAADRLEEVGAIAGHLSFCMRSLTSRGLRNFGDVSGLCKSLTGKNDASKH